MNISAQRMGREKLLSELKTLDAERVFLALGTDCVKPGQREKELAALKENTAWFRSRGYEVGAWLWAFMLSGVNDFAHMRSPEGVDSADTICPSDKEYQKMMGGFLKEIAACGVDLIMFDDDYRYGFHDVDIACTCKNHLAMIRELTDSDISEKELCGCIRRGAPNKYRDAFVKANGAALEEFAAIMREHVDKVDKNIRLGFCSCITSWDIDGTTPDRLSRIMAGDTKPFYRLIGAPYWGARNAFGARLADVIEFERLEASRRKDKNIEIFGEGDAYPRPRFHTPASYMEGFDTALRASGATDGILKYAVDYTSNPGYETGYGAFHIRNKPVYKKIDRLFSDKEAIGVRIYSKALKMTDMTIPDGYKLNELSFPYPARFLAPHGIPMTYEGAGTFGLAFGADVDEVPAEALSGGMILDAAACERLARRGVDTGIISFGEELSTSEEIYRADGNHVSITFGAKVRKLSVSDKAELISEFQTDTGLVPASFRYENADGQRFLIFAFDGYLASESLFRTYARGNTVIDSSEWLCGKKLPAVLRGAPDVYTITKRGADRTVTGIWNFFADAVLSPAVELDGDYTATDTINCTAKIKDGRAYLSELPAFGFAAIEYKKL